MLLRRGRHPAVVANDIFTRDDADHARNARQGIFDTGRIRGVATGACPTPRHGKIPASTSWP